MAVLFQLGLDYMQGHYVHEPEVVLQVAPESKQTSLAELAAAKRQLADFLRVNY